MTRSFDVIDIGYRYMDREFSYDEMNNANFLDFAQACIAIEDLAHYYDKEDISFPTVDDLTKYVSLRKPTRLGWYGYELPILVEFTRFVCQKKMQFDRGEELWK